MATTQMEVMPREFNLTAPATIPQARTYLFKRQSDLQTYDIQKGNRIRINIPRLQRTYLNKNSYLRFRVNVDITQAKSGLCFDRCGAYGLFDRLEVYDYLGGTLIEQVQNIPALMVLLNDINSGYTEMNGLREATEGYSGSGIYAKDTEQGSLDTPLELLTANTGSFLFPKNDATLVKTQFITKEYAIHLPSFLDMFSDKNVPLHNGFSVDLYLNSVEQAFVSRIWSARWPTDESQNMVIKEAWLSNVELCCQVTELGDYAEKLMLSTSDPWVVHSKFYRYFSDMITGKTEDGRHAISDQNSSVSQSSFRLDLNLNVVSLRNILFAMRPRFYQNSILYPSYGHRIRNYLENFNFQYGSSYLPEIAGVSCRAFTVPISRSSYSALSATVTAGVPDFKKYPSGASPKADSFTQALEELSKVSSTGKVAITPEEYRVDCGSGKLGNSSNADLWDNIPWRWDSNTRCGKFAGGLNLQLSKRDAVCGMDTNGLNVCINGTFNSDAASATPVGDGIEINDSTVTPMVYAILDCWAEHDSFVQIIPGVATTVTF
jgi:hypothetical protein